MSRADFIENVAKRSKVTKAEAKRMVEAVFGEIEQGLKGAKKAEDGRYAIGGFGVFSVSKRGARTGRNPRTGETIKIKASKVLKFRPAASLKKAAGI